YQSIKEILAETRINENRIKIVSISAGEGEKFAQVIKEFKDQLETLGPIQPDEYLKPISKSSHAEDKTNSERV
ncbi:hypothetical protein LCGC14_1902300, partial [marine sediment metagenome]